MRLWILLCILALQGCAWNKSDFNLNEEKAREERVLKKDFKIDADVYEKFKTEEVAKAAPTPADKKGGKDAPPSEEVASAPAPSKPVAPATGPYPGDFPAKLRQVDKTSADLWSLFKLPSWQREKVTYSIKYLGINTGKIVMRTLPPVKVKGNLAHRFHAHFKSAPFYSYIYELDDTVETVVEQESFIPIKYKLLQRESKKDIDDIQLYDREQLKTHFYYKQVKNGQTEVKKMDHYIPRYFQDSFSALYFFRGLPTTAGSTYTFPVVTRTKVWLIDAKVVGREKLYTAIGPVPSVKIEAITRYTGDMVRKGNVTFWISDDERKVMLKFKATVKIGAVTGDILEYSK